VPLCDVCVADTTFEEATVYTPDEFRRVVSLGFRPHESILRNVAIADWKGFVAQSATDWVLCPSCAALTGAFMHKPTGTGLITPRPHEPITRGTSRSIRKQSRHYVRLDKSRRLFGIDASKLEEGDVLLLATPPSATRYVIRKVTSSRFSHAAICSNAPLFVEAIGVGVCVFTIDKIVVSNPRSIRLLRVHSRHSAVARRAGFIASTYVARQYWISGALTAVLSKLQLQARGKLFCSHLVAQAYAEAGLALVSDKNPTKVTPALLEQSTLLRDISCEVLTDKTDKAWCPPMMVIDEANYASPAQLETRIKQNIVRRVGKSFTFCGLPAPLDFEGALYGLLGLTDPVNSDLIDEEFSKAIREEGLLAVPLAFQDMESIYRYVADGADERVWSHEEMSAMLGFFTERFSTQEKILDERRTCLDTRKTIVTRTNLATFKALAALDSEYYRLEQVRQDVTRRVVSYLRSVLELCGG